MRTTINLDDDLLRRAKQEAARRGTTLTALLHDALRAALAGDRSPDAPDRLVLRPYEGDGLLPGVDLDDSAALLDRMEGR